MIIHSEPLTRSRDHRRDEFPLLNWRVSASHRVNCRSCEKVLTGRDAGVQPGYVRQTLEASAVASLGGGAFGR